LERELLGRSVVSLTNEITNLKNEMYLLKKQNIQNSNYLSEGKKMIEKKDDGNIDLLSSTYSFFPSFPSFSSPIFMNNPLPFRLHIPTSSTSISHSQLSLDCNDSFDFHSVVDLYPLEISDMKYNCNYDILDI
jgi:hypothetical protein